MRLTSSWGNEYKWGLFGVLQKENLMFTQTNLLLKVIFSGFVFLSLGNAQIFAQDGTNEQGRHEIVAAAKNFYNDLDSFKFRASQYQFYSDLTSDADFLLEETQRFQTLANEEVSDVELRSQFQPLRLDYEHLSRSFYQVYDRYYFQRYSGEMLVSWQQCENSFGQLERLIPY